MARPLNLASYPVAIAAGAALSGAVSIGADGICGIVFPAGWTVAVATFQVSVDGTTWVEMYDAAGNEVTISATSTAAAAYAAINQTLWRGVNLFKIRSGTATAPVNQVAAANLIVVGRGDEW